MLKPEVNGPHYRTAKDRPNYPQRQTRLDPAETVDLELGVRSAEAHARDEEEDGGEEEGLVEAQSVVGVVDQLLRADVLVGGVDDPGLRHGPAVELAVVVDEGDHEEADAQEEQVELVLARALQDEPGFLTHSVNLAVEIQTEYEVDQAVYQSDHILINENCTSIKTSHKYPYSDQKQDSE